MADPLLIVSRVAIFAIAIVTGYKVEKTIKIAG